MAAERKRGFFRRLFGAEGEAPDDQSEAATGAHAQEAVSDITVNARGGPDADVHYPAAASATVDEEAGALSSDFRPSYPAAPDASSEPAPEDVSQLRTDAVVTPPPSAPVFKAAVPPRAARSWWERLTSGLSRSSQSLTSGIADVLTKRRLDRATLDDLEALLIRADLGVEVAARIADALARERMDRDVDPDEVRGVLAGEMEKVLGPVAKPLNIEAAVGPFVILMVGVNGTGKTTTIGKLAARFRSEGKHVMLAAGDTFRAAAIEQLKIWGERARVPVIAREPGSDAAGLAFDARVEARKAAADVLLIDTAGRLHNKSELMAELAKVIRVIRKHDAAAPHAVLLTLDATTGQNALNQVEVFRDQMGVTGLVMTKLDGTARGGILVAIAAKTGLPVHFIGVGEAIEDLAPFSARDFSRAIAGLD